MHSDPLQIFKLHKSRLVTTMFECKYAAGIVRFPKSDQVVAAMGLICIHISCFKWPIAICAKTKGGFPLSFANS